MIAAVVIGRNEGERLVRCLTSLGGQVDRIVYVDSGSIDGSLTAARAADAEVVELDASLPFTAARARNTGVAHLGCSGTPPDLIQFVDGDCEVRSGWIEAARDFLEHSPDVAVVFGRRRERHPEASVWNRLIDDEWDDIPVGEVRSCGGDFLMRKDAFLEAGGFNEALIAGEEPELCLRLRRADWKIWRINREMTLHDASMTRFSQWWTRARRAGHAYAEGAALHGAAPERYRVMKLASILGWSFGPPLLAVGGAAVSPWLFLFLGLWPLLVLRLRLNGQEWPRAFFLAVEKLPQAQGVLQFLTDRLAGRRRLLIEYK